MQSADIFRRWRRIMRVVTTFHYLIILTWCIALILAPAHALSAAQETEKKQSDSDVALTAPATTSKSMQGDIDTLRPDYVTIVYAQDKGSKGEVVKDYEAVFPVDNSTMFVYKNSLSEFVEGDKVEVTYDEIKWVDEKGVERVERKAKQLKFIRSAIKGLRSE